MRQATRASIVATETGFTVRVLDHTNNWHTHICANRAAVDAALGALYEEVPVPKADEAPKKKRGK